MRISLSMWSVHTYWYGGKWGVTDFLRFAAGTKAEGVELLSVFWKDRERELPEIDRALDELGLKVACFCACNNFVSADAEERAAQLREVKEAVDMAVHFGAPVVRVFSGDRPDDKMPVDEGMGYVLEGLKAAAAYAEEKGKVLCLENHGLFAGRSDQVSAIIREVGSPALLSTFDTGNFLLVGQDPSSAVQRAAGLGGACPRQGFSPDGAGGGGEHNRP
ncbi:sugar phosphate isomerase/epimerase family protein [Paenibacillus sp. 1P03SA]|uniref:sugar phosphate isomerase/epimerase family protein n=1 Tax=Paenibacillus sp. 1P03SA TaxID=3132294 RepID=UPI00399FA1F0